MSRYIDLETIKPRQYENSEVELGVLAYDYDEANAMPFLDIVRCKECRYKDTELCPMLRLIVAGVRKYDDYCSYGEREGE